MTPLLEMAAADGAGSVVFKGISAVSRTAISKLVGYGSDAAIIENTANLIPKRGWYDAVVHGTEDGLGFTINNQFTSPSNYIRIFWQMDTSMELR